MPEVKPGRPPRRPNRRHLKKLLGPPYRGGLERLIVDLNSIWSTPTTSALTEDTFRRLLETARPTPDNTSIDVTAPRDPTAPYVIIDNMGPISVDERQSR